MTEDKNNFLISYPYHHPVFNPEGKSEFEGNIYEKIILEQEYKNLIEKKNGAEGTDPYLEIEISKKIYSEFGKYLNQKNSNTPILNELISNYIGTKLIQVRMNKEFYKNGIMKMSLRQDPKTGEIKEFYTKHPLLKDFTEINAMSMQTLAKINEIISGVKIEVVNKTTSIRDLMDELQIIDVESNEKHNNLLK